MPARPAVAMVTEFDEEIWNVALDVNLKGAVLVCKHAVPRMAESGGGSVINISSIDGLLAGAYINVPYSVAKGGLGHSDQADGRSPRPPKHSRQLHCARARSCLLHSRLLAGGTGAAAQDRAAGDGGYGLGRGVCGSLFCE